MTLMLDRQEKKAIKIYSFLLLDCFANRLAVIKMACLTFYTSATTRQTKRGGGGGGGGTEKETETDRQRLRQRQTETEAETETEKQKQNDSQVREQKQTLRLALSQLLFLV